MKMRLTKKKAMELFKKVFGTSAGIMEDQAVAELFGEAWKISLGSISAVCYLQKERIVLRVTWAGAHDEYMYYTSDLEFDQKYYLQKKEEERKEDAFDYMNLHNLAVVSMRDANAHNLKQIYDDKY